MDKITLQVVLDKKDAGILKEMAEKEYLSISTYLRKIIKGLINGK